MAMESDAAPQHHVYTHPSPVEHWRHAVEIVALIIAAVWGFYVFVYQERIKPATETPILDVRPTVSTERLRGGNLLVHVLIDEKDIGPVDLQIVATAINVYGFKYSPSMKHRDLTEATAGRYSYVNSLPPSKFVLLSSSETLYRPAGVGASWNGFAPGNEKTLSPTFAVHARDFDAVKVMFTVCYTRLDDKRVVAIEPRRMADGAWDSEALAASLHDTFHCGYTAGNNGLTFAI